MTANDTEPNVAAISCFRRKSRQELEEDASVFDPKRTRRDLIISLTARFGLPAIHSFGFHAASGGLNLVWHQ